MKSFKLLIFILIILGLLNYLNFLLTDNHIYALKIGFPLTIYYEFIIDGDTQFSYYPKNIVINIIIVVTIYVVIKLFGNVPDVAGLKTNFKIGIK